MARRGVAAILEGRVEARARGGRSLHRAGGADPAEDHRRQDDGVRQRPRRRGAHDAGADRPDQKGAARRAVDQEGAGDEHTNERAGKLDCWRRLLVGPARRRPSRTSSRRSRSSSSRPIIRRRSGARPTWSPSRSGCSASRTRSGSRTISTCRGATRSWDRSSSRRRWRSSSTTSPRRAPTRRRAICAWSTTNTRASTRISSPRRSRSRFCRSSRRPRRRRRCSRRRCSSEMATREAAGQARDKIAAAELALKGAEQVNAPEYAKVEFQSAQDTLARRAAQLKASDFAMASQNADAARDQANRATADGEADLREALVDDGVAGAQRGAGARSVGHSRRAGAARAARRRAARGGAAAWAVRAQVDGDSAGPRGRARRSSRRS